MNTRPPQTSIDSPLPSPREESHPGLAEEPTTKTFVEPVTGDDAQAKEQTALRPEQTAQLDQQLDLPVLHNETPLLDPTATPGPAAPANPVRRVAGKVRRRVTRLTRAMVRVEMTTWDSATVSWRIPPRHRTYQLGVPEKSCRLAAQSVHIRVPDLAALTRLATSGLLTGSTFGLSVTIANCPRWLRGGNRSIRTLWATTSQTWKVHKTAQGTSSTATLTWSRKRPLDRALADLMSLHSREHGWPQTCGPVYAEDRHAFARSATTWPRAYLVERSPYDSQEPLGPYSPPPAQAPIHDASWPLVTTTANPYHRELVGLPATYTARIVADPNRTGISNSAQALVIQDAQGVPVLTLDSHRSPEAQINPGQAQDNWQKFATLQLPDDLPATWTQDRFLTLAVRGLAACGMILRCANPQVRQGLQAQGLLVEDTTLSTPATLEMASPGEILGGYVRSVASSRAAIISSDALLRVSPLAGLYGTSTATGDPLVALPTISITASSKRADDIPSCLEYLAAQTYPAYEIVLGTHGYTLPAELVTQWEEKLQAKGVPLRVVALPQQLSFGQVLGRLATLADGELITKVDDDDHYGPHHLTDLMLAYRVSGVDMVAKSSRFTYFTDHDFTIDRTWGAREAFDGTPAGGTIMITRSALTEIGGWSPSVRHVDTDLIARARAYAIPRYRTHSLGYVYVRRASGHTWAANHDDLLAQGQHRYEGLPTELLG